MVWGFSRWLPRRPSWISERNDFSNFESHSSPSSSHQISAQSILWFWRRCRRCEKFTTDGLTTNNRPWHTLNCSKAPGELRIKHLKDGCRCGHLGYHNEMLLAILNLHVAPMPPIKFRLNPIFSFGRRWGSKVFKMVAIGTERFKQVWISLSFRCLPLCFGSIQLKVWKEMSFE